MALGAQSWGSLGWGSRGHFKSHVVPNVRGGRMVFSCAGMGSLLRATRRPRRKLVAEAPPRRCPWKPAPGNASSGETPGNGPAPPLPVGAVHAVQCPLRTSKGFAGSVACCRLRRVLPAPPRAAGSAASLRLICVVPKPLGGLSIRCTCKAWTPTGVWQRPRPAAARGNRPLGMFPPVRQWQRPRPAVAREGRPCYTMPPPDL